MLQRQYRMNEEIAAFPGEHIYDGKLETGEENRTWTVGDLKPIMAVDVEGDEQTDDVTKSKKNPTEAQIVADHVKLLQMQDVPLKDIGVITPYAAQIGEIRSAVNEEIGHLGGLKIDTIDSFQGSEREAIIISFVRSNSGNHSGFLSLPEEGKRRLNVAMTRAKKRLVLIGDWNTLGTAAGYEDADSTSELYATLYSMLNAQDRVKEINTQTFAD
jgi:superfamily I DNA and/or RNA helicase